MQILVDHRKEQTDAFVLATGRLTNGGRMVGGSRLLTPGLRYLLVFIPGLHMLVQEYTQRWLIVYIAYRIDENEMIVFQEPRGIPSVPSAARPKVPLSEFTRYLVGDLEELWL